MAAVMAAGVLAVRGCSAEPEASPGTAGEQDAAADAADARLDGSRDGDARVDVDARTDADAAADVAPTDARLDAALPDGVPPGWEEYTGWSADCPLYVPGPGAQMPPPIEWEPCPAPPVPPELGCRRMKNTWNGMIGYYPNFSLDPQTGAALLQFTRTGAQYNNSVFYRLVAEADGPVRTALLQTNGSWDCQFFEESLADGRYAVSALTRPQGGGADAGKEEGILAGSIDDRTPTTVLKLPADPTTSSSWRISSDWIVQMKYGRKAWTWDLSSTTTIYDPAQDPDGLPAYLPIIHHKDVFLIVGDFGLCGVMSWNPTVGLRPLLRWYGDPTRGAGNFGTDGVDMVWTYTRGAHACHTDMEDSREVWTAPYTLDPAQVQSTARRLRSDVRGMTGDSYAVGFGYAARGSTFGSPLANSLFIVRLSDGVSWVVPGDPTDADRLSWGPNVLGFTHDEVFLTGSMQGELGIFRIRLDTLGPGTPPD